MYRPSGESAAAPALPEVVIWEIFMLCRLNPRGRRFSHTDAAAATATTASATTIAVTARFAPLTFGSAAVVLLVTGTLPELVSRLSLFSSERISAALW